MKVLSVLFKLLDSCASRTPTCTHVQENSLWEHSLTEKLREESRK